MTISFEPCSHRLSLVTGIYVIIDQDSFAATCNTLDLVTEFLRGVGYSEAHNVRIYLSDIADFDKDEITHLIAQDMFDGYDSYADWASRNEDLPWLEYWFDEWGSLHRTDYTRRLKRYNEINAPVRG